MNKKKQYTKGFTLIELMVSVSIFAIVLLVAMGSILTIVDSNRKARTLTEVMNNVNFTLESITRSIKTGVDPQYNPSQGNPSQGILSVVGIDLAANSFARQRIYYRAIEENGNGYIERRIGDGPWIPITSDQINIKRFFVNLPFVEDFNQPRTQLTIEGEVKMSEKITSSFVIQTTISQRKLNLAGSEE